LFTRLNFVAIVTVLLDLARDDLTAHDPQIYENLPRNQRDTWSDIVVRNGYLLQPGMTQAYRADLAFDQLRSERQLAGCLAEDAAERSSHRPESSRIVIVGDASFQGAGQFLDASNSVLVAPFEVGVKGISAKTWLDSAGLSRLTQLGIGRLYWSVSAENQVDAATHAQQLAKPGTPIIEILKDSAKLPSQVLSELPSLPASNLLGDLLSVLGASDVDSIATLQTFWRQNSNTLANPARLRKGQAASFLIISAAPQGQINFGRSRLESVWLDGHD
jgi:hypothetical protein